VWSTLQSFDRLALTLRENEPHCFTIPLEHITAHSLGPGQPPEWGPDLCFVRIPDNYIGTIKTSRVFYNLASRKESALAEPVDYNFGLWVLMGVPAVESVLTETFADLKFFGGISNVYAVHERDGFDFIDVRINLHLDLPSTFGGMSGGGLWQVIP